MKTAQAEITTSGLAGPVCLQRRDLLHQVPFHMSIYHARQPTQQDWQDNENPCPGKLSVPVHWVHIQVVKQASLTFVQFTCTLFDLQK